MVMLLLIFLMCFLKGCFVVLDVKYRFYKSLLYSAVFLLLWSMTLQFLVVINILLYAIKKVIKLLVLFLSLPWSQAWTQLCANCSCRFNIDSWSVYKILKYVSYYISKEKLEAFHKLVKGLRELKVSLKYT